MIITEQKEKPLPPDLQHKLYITEQHEQKFKPTINVPKQDAPTVNVTVPKPQRVKRTVHRDEAGDIKSVTETPVEE